MPAVLKEPDFISEMYCVSAWEDVNAALKSPKFLGARKLKLPTRENILGLINGSEHLERRQIESPVFHRDALADYERTTLQPLLARYVEQWRDDGGAELVEESLMLLVRIGALLTGIGEIDNDGDAHAILDDVGVFAAAINVEYSKLPEEDQQRLVQSAQAKISDFDDRYIQPARITRTALLARVAHGELERDALPRDVVAQMVAHWNDDWEPQLIALEVLSYLVASVRTSMRAICHSVDEIHRWVVAHPEDEALITDPAFVRKAVNESLRLHAIVPILMRLTSDAVTLPSGLEIPEGTYVAVLYVQANRDPRQFGEDAEDFDPHRSERGLPGRDYGFSFAAGEHACIGRRLAVGAGGEADTANNGTVMTIVEQLMKLGARPDEDDPPVPNDASFVDEFVRYPIKLAKV